MSGVNLLDKKIDKIIYFSTFIATLFVMIPMTAYVARQITTLTEFLASLTGLTAIACSIHLFSFRKLLKQSRFNTDNQQNVLFVATVVFFELRGIKYKIRKTESKSNFAFHVEWTLSDPQTEQLRAIFCSLCIHNFKGITPTKKTRIQLQRDWEDNLVENLTEIEKKKLWKEHTKILREDFNNNKKVFQKIHKAILINSNCDSISNLIKTSVIHRNDVLERNKGR